MKSIKEAKVKGKQVLIRVDFNVPLKDGKVADDKRIKASLPTIQYLIKKKAKIILISHLGRPDGQVKDEYRLAPAALRLSKLLKKPVHYLLDCIGESTEDSVSQLKQGEIMLLENLRFYPEEEKNDDKFAQKLAALADIYVNDAFGVSHRAHSSVHAITKYLPSYSGFLLQKEIQNLSKLLKTPKRPYIAILGGAKVSDKIGVIENLLKKVDTILIGGAMMFTFYKSIGYEVGKSKYEPDKLQLSKKLLKQRKIMLPIDVMIAKGTNEKNGKITSTHDIPKNTMGLDIGPVTQQVYIELIKRANTIFWNGPLGLAENPAFAKGTINVAKAIAKNKGTTIIGGGDSVAVIEKLKLEKKYTHVSTGGGASLELLEGKTLPGIDALNKNKLN